MFVNFHPDKPASIYSETVECPCRAFTTEPKHEQLNLL